MNIVKMAFFKFLATSDFVCRTISRKMRLEESRLDVFLKISAQTIVKIKIKVKILTFRQMIVS